MKDAQFQLIIGETKTGRFLRKMLPVSYGLAGVFLLCALLPAMRFLVPIIGALWLLLIGSVVIIELCKVKLYVLGGIIKLEEAGIMFNDKFIQISELQQVIVKFGMPRGQGTGRNGAGNQGNTINVRTKSAAEMMFVVLIEARAQRYNLARVLLEWRSVGVKVVADGLDLA